MKRNELHERHRTAARSLCDRLNIPHPAWLADVGPVDPTADVLLLEQIAERLAGAGAVVSKMKPQAH